mgnify:CR=1 FL=1
MDRNGYNPSLLGDWMFCAMCFRFVPKLQRHEVFHNDMGGKLRAKSKKYGLWLSVCPACHARIHTSPKENADLKARAQRMAMKQYGWTLEDWRREFGKSYL